MLHIPSADVWICKTWTVNNKREDHEKRRILRIDWMDKITNNRVIEKANQQQPGYEK